MTVKLAINGFGAIGRRVFRAGWEVDDVEFVGINDITEPKVLAYLLKYDSNYGRFDEEIEATEDSLIIGGREIPVFAEKDPANLPWEELGVDVVVESTGIFTNGEDAKKHLKAGAKKVIISAPAKNEDLTVVLGVNEDQYNPAQHNIISNASCTTNCLAPVAKVLHDSFGLKKGLITTVHSYTGNQAILDAPASFKKITRGRAAAQNIVPTTTGAAKAVTLVLPELKGKLNGMAIRVPTPTVSIVDLVAQLEQKVTVEDIHAAMKEAAEGPMKGILGYEETPLVSRDYLGDPRSSIYDATQTMVIEDDLVKVLSWYDNEWGYSCRVIDLALYLAEKGF